MSESYPIQPIISSPVNKKICDRLPHSAGQSVLKKLFPISLSVEGAEAIRHTPLQNKIPASRSLSWAVPKDSSQ